MYNFLKCFMFDCKEFLEKIDLYVYLYACVIVYIYITDTRFMLTKNEKKNLIKMKGDEFWGVKHSSKPLFRNLLQLQNKENKNQQNTHYERTQEKQQNCSPKFIRFITFYFYSFYFIIHFYLFGYLKR